MTEALDDYTFSLFQRGNKLRQGQCPAAKHYYCTAALIFSAASGETHLDQVASLFFR